MYARLSLLCCGAAAATQLAVLRLSSPLATVPRQQPARLCQPSMHVHGEPPDGRNWLGGGQGERSAEFRARRRAARQSQPQSSSVNPPPSDAQMNQPSQSPFMAHMNQQPESPFTAQLEAPPLVLIFNAGRPDEGVYTQSQRDGTPTILSFEDADDAHRFGQVLASKGFDMPSPQYWPRGRLTTFCHTTGFSVTVVPRGTTPEPPSERLDNYFGQPGPERAPKPDAYSAHRLWLDKLMDMNVDNCGDDDCILG